MTDKHEKKFKLDIRRICLCLGVALLIGAAALAGYNLYTDWHAGQVSQSVIEQMELPAASEPEESASSVSESASSEADSEYWDGGMAEEEIDSDVYIGSLSIPAIGVTLPINTEWDAALAKKAPCRYKGSAYDGTMIIAGHNYRSHFGKLKELEVGDKACFTGVDGSVFWYELTGFESIDMYDFDGMDAGDWDLTLFTCDASRVRRVTARFKEISRSAPEDSAQEGSSSAETS